MLPDMAPPSAESERRPREGERSCTRLAPAVVQETVMVLPASAEVLEDANDTIVGRTVTVVVAVRGPAVMV
jgi:hypothetical protein